MLCARQGVEAFSCRSSTGSDRVCCPGSTGGSYSGACGISFTCQAGQYCCPDTTCCGGCGSVPPSSCPAPSTPSKGKVGGGGTSVGNSRTVSCAAGYSGSCSPTSITCQSSGAWSSSSCGGCLRVCSSPATPAEGKVGAGGSVQGNTRTVACAAGYSGACSATTITCQSNGAWTGVSCTSCLRVCSAPALPTNGQLTGSGTTEGSTRSVSCASGYSGSCSAASITCQANGAWTTSDCAACLIICPAPSTPTNGQLTGSGITDGSTRSVACVSGYTGSCSPATMTCQSTGAWSTSDCTACVKICPAPSTPTNGALSGSGVLVGATRSVACAFGYTGACSPTSMSCQDSQTWTTSDCASCAGLTTVHL